MLPNTCWLDEGIVFSSTGGGFLWNSLIIAWTTRPRSECGANWNNLQVFMENVLDNPTYI